MTDHTRSVHDAEDAMEEMDDLELITMAVNGHLSPERLAEVRHRLETDAAFREVAAPVLLTWSVPPRLEPEPRPIDELERDWDAFAKKAGIGRYRVATRAPSGRGGRGGRRGWWLAGIILVVAGLAATAVYVVAPRIEAARARAREAAAEAARVAAREAALDSMSTRVPYQTGWMPLMEGIEVRLEPGASLRRAHRRLQGMRHVLLDGTARFRVPDLDSGVKSLRTQSLAVQTAVGLVTASNAELTVTTRGDTTEVQVHALPMQPKPGAWGVTLAEALEISHASQLLYLGELGAMRVIRGHDPERLPPFN